MAASAIYCLLPTQDWLYWPGRAHGNKDNVSNTVDNTMNDLCPVLLFYVSAMTFQYYAICFDAMRITH